MRIPDRSAHIEMRGRFEMRGISYEWYGSHLQFTLNDLTITVATEQAYPNDIKSYIYVNAGGDKHKNWHWKNPTTWDALPDQAKSIIKRAVEDVNLHIQNEQERLAREKVERERVVAEKALALENELLRKLAGAELEMMGKR